MAEEPSVPEDTKPEAEADNVEVVPPQTEDESGPPEGSEAVKERAEGEESETESEEEEEEEDDDLKYTREDDRDEIEIIPQPIDVVDEGEYPGYTYAVPIYYDDGEYEEDLEFPQKIIMPPQYGEMEGWTGREGGVLSQYSVTYEETEEETQARLIKEKKLEQYKQKIIERMILRRKNTYLQKKLVEHFKRRRMDHVLKEDTSKGLDQETKYLKRLYNFFKLKEDANNERTELEEEVRLHKEIVKKAEEEFHGLLEELQTKQKAVGATLVFSKSGKKLNPQTVEKLSDRQRQKSEEIASVRLKFIKLKHAVDQNEATLTNLESVGEGLHLMDYEQLKVDRQNLTDKLEEKEDELSLLRTKTTQNIQNLAQLREKAFSIEGDIEQMRIEVENVEETYEATRERLANLKLKRDFLREERTRLKKQYGLLTNDLLLREFEESLDSVEVMEAELKDLQDKVKFYNLRIKQIKKLKSGRTSSYIDFRFPFEIITDPNKARRICAKKALSSHPPIKFKNK